MGYEKNKSPTNFKETNIKTILITVIGGSKPISEMLLQAGNLKVLL